MSLAGASSRCCEIGAKIRGQLISLFVYLQPASLGLAAERRFGQMPAEISWLPTGELGGRRLAARGSITRAACALGPLPFYGTKKAPPATMALAGRHKSQNSDPNLGRRARRFGGQIEFRAPV